MFDIDKKTLFLDFTATIIICIIFIFMLWYNHKNRYQGLFLIWFSYVLNIVSSTLIFLRDTVGDFYSIVLSNELTMIGMFCIFVGLEKFIEVRSKHTLYYLYLVLFMIAQSYFTLVIPNMAARNVNISVGHIVFCTSIVFLLFYRTPKSLRNITREIGIVFIFFIAVNIIRFFDQLSIVPVYRADNLKLMNFDLYILLLYQIFAIATGFVSVHMVNKRLNQDILNDEKEIILSRNILKKLFVNLQTEYENDKIDFATQIDNNLNQSLAALRMNLGFIKKKLSKNEQTINPELISLVEQTYRQTGITIESSLSLMHNVRNEILYLYGIVDAIKLNIEEIQKQTDIICNFKYSSENIELEKKRSFALFNLYQDVIFWLLNSNETEKVEIELEKEDKVVRLKIIIIANNLDWTDKEVDENSQIAILNEKATIANGTLHIKKLSDTESLIIIEI